MGVEIPRSCSRCASRAVRGIGRSLLREGIRGDLSWTRAHGDCRKGAGDRQQLARGNVLSVRIVFRGRNSAGPVH